MPKLSRADKIAAESANAARLRKERALADMREMERDRRRGELVPAAEVRHMWVTVAKLVREAVLRIPDKCGPAVAAAANPREARAMLQTECESILRSLSDALRTADQ